MQESTFKIPNLKSKKIVSVWGDRQHHLATACSGSMKILAIANHNGERTRLVPRLREQWRPRHSELFLCNDALKISFAEAPKGARKGACVPPK
jgi:hypothetical protein